VKEKADFDLYHKEDGFCCYAKVKEGSYHKGDIVDCCSKKMMVYAVQLLW